MAALLAHEACHLKHGSDERRAYRRQLAVLRALDADRDAIEYVKTLVWFQRQHEASR